MRTSSSRTRVARPLLCAAILGATLACAAHATAQTTAIVVAAGHAQSHHDDPTQFLSSAGNQSRGVGVTNSLNNATVREPFDGFIFSDQQAEYRGPADASGRASIGTSLRDFLKVDNLHGETADLTSLATISSTDQVTLTGLPSDHRRVTFHTSLEVFEGAGDPGAQIFYDTFDDSTDFDVRGHSQIRVASSGIGPSALGNDTFSETTFHVEPGHESRGVFGLPSFLDFNLTFNLGEATDFNVSLIQTMELFIEDRRADLNVNFEMIDGVRLTWSGFSTLTDAQTGQSVCGLTINSASGVNYGSIAACQGGGGGGGGTAVPEPAAWALMIAGFGLTGAALRRRRLGQQVLGL